MVILCCNDNNGLTLCSTYPHYYHVPVNKNSTTPQCLTTSAGKISDCFDLLCYCNDCKDNNSLTAGSTYIHYHHVNKNATTHWLTTSAGKISDCYDVVLLCHCIIVRMIMV